MLYREAGQFKTSYAADQQLFPIRQDRIGILILLAVVFLVIPGVASEYWFSAILIPFLIFSLAALGLNILTGYAGQLSLGSAAFMAVGAYAAYNFQLRIDGIPILVSFICAGLTAAGVGILFGLPSLWIKGFYLAVATLAAQFFIVWCLTKFPWFSNHSSSGVISAQKLIILGHEFTSPQEKYLLVLTIVVVMALAAKKYGAFIHWPRLDGGARYGRGRFGHRHPLDADQAAGVRRQFVLLRGGGRALCLLLSGLGGTGRLFAGYVVPHPVHDHHRRSRLDPG